MWVSRIAAIRASSVKLRSNQDAYHRAVSNSTDPLQQAHKGEAEGLTFIMPIYQHIITDWIQQATVLLVATCCDNILTYWTFCNSIEISIGEKDIASTATVDKTLPGSIALCLIAQISVAFTHTRSRLTLTCIIFSIVMSKCVEVKLLRSAYAPHRTTHIDL